jgi:hypothetical protein
LQTATVVERVTAEATGLPGRRPVTMTRLRMGPL